MDWDFVTALFRLLLLLPIVILLAYLVIRYGLGRINSPLLGKGSAMRVVDRLPITAKSVLLVVKVVDRYFLLVQNDNSTSFLRELEEYPEESGGETGESSGRNSFMVKLKQKIIKQRFGDKGDWEE